MEVHRLRRCLCIIIRFEHDDDRHRLAERAVLHLLAELGAIFLRQQRLDDRQVGLQLLHRLHALFGAGRRYDLIPCLSEGSLDALYLGLIMIDYEDFVAHVTVPCRIVAPDYGTVLHPGRSGGRPPRT